MFCLGVQTIVANCLSQRGKHERCLFREAVFRLVGGGAAVGNGFGVSVMRTDSMFIRKSMDTAEAVRVRAFNCIFDLAMFSSCLFTVEEVSKSLGFVGVAGEGFRPVFKEFLSLLLCRLLCFSPEVAACLDPELDLWDGEEGE